MSETISGIIGAGSGFIIGSVLTINFGVMPLDVEVNRLKQEAIEHNVAQYDTKTGEFEWKEGGCDVQ